MPAVYDPLSGIRTVRDGRGRRVTVLTGSQYARRPRVSPALGQKAAAGVQLSRLGTAAGRGAPPASASSSSASRQRRWPWHRNGTGRRQPASKPLRIRSTTRPPTRSRPISSVVWLGSSRTYWLRGYARSQKTRARARCRRRRLLVVLSGRVDSRATGLLRQCHRGDSRQIGPWDLFAAVFPLVSQ